MKRAFFALLFALGFIASARSQTASDPNEGTRLSLGSGNSYAFSWWGRTGRTYFIQHSEDLANWVYFPDIIDSGTNALLSYGFSVSGPDRFFLRLKYTDIPTGNPNTADFDGDGVSNWDELMQGTDPLSWRDTDINGLPDDWEIRYFGHLGVDPNVDPDGDGASNLQEWLNHTNPTDFYNGSPPSIAIEFGNGQKTSPGAVLGAPFLARVYNSGGDPLVNAPVTFEVASGGGQVSLERRENPFGTTLQTRTDSGGYAVAYYKQPTTLGVTSQIQVKATVNQGTVTANFSAITVGVPLNDNFANATSISGASGVATGSNGGGTFETGEPKHADTLCGASVWFGWQCPATGDYRLVVSSSNFDPICAIYTGASVATLTTIAGNDDDEGSTLHTSVSAVVFHGIQGTTYYIAVDGFDSSTGDFEVAWGAPTGPGNDLFAMAQTLSGVSGTLSGTNVFSTSEPGEPNHAGETSKSSIWYRWVAPGNGAVTFETAGSDFDTLLAVYQGNSLESLTLAAANDDEVFEEITTSKVTLPIVTGTEYRIAVAGYAAKTGSVTLSWSLEVSNDMFADARVLSGANGTSITTNTTATKETGEPDHAGNSGGASIWFTWQAPDNTSITFDTVGSDFDTLLAVYTGLGLASLTEIGSNDDSGGLTSSVTFTPVAGTVYRIAVDGYVGSIGNVHLNWGASAETPAAPTGALPPPPTIPANPDPQIRAQIVAQFGAAAAVAADEEDCEDPPQPNQGDAGEWRTQDDGMGGTITVLASTRTLYFGLREQIEGRPPNPPCPQNVNITHRIITRNTPRARDLPGKLTLTLKDGDASLVEIKHNGTAYTLGTPVAVTETGHSGCGIHTWHTGDETFVFTPKAKGTLVLEAEVDPDPDDGGDGTARQKLTLTIQCIEVTYRANPGGAMLPYAVSAKTAWPDQEVATRKQKVQVITDPAQFADQIVLRVVELDTNTNPEYQPTGLGSITKSGAAEWLYEAFEEPKSVKHPKVRKVIIRPYLNDQELCAPFRAEVESVFEWLIRTGHKHGPDGTATHSFPFPDADYSQALKYAKWKYDISTKNINFKFAKSGPLSSGNGYTEMYSGLFGSVATSTPRNANIYPGAFSSENNCASTLGHENVHGGQKALGNIDRRSSAKKNRNIEYPAYLWEYQNADANGLTAEEKETVRKSMEDTKEGKPPDPDN